MDIDGQEILLRGTRLVIPLSLQKHVDLAQAGHLGIVKTKTLQREKVWFPFIDSLVEEKCKNCIPCLSVSSHNPPEPVKISMLPNRVGRSIRRLSGTHKRYKLCFSYHR